MRSNQNLAHVATSNSTTAPIAQQFTAKDVLSNPKYRFGQSGGGQTSRRKVLLLFWRGFRNNPAQLFQGDGQLAIHYPTTVAPLVRSSVPLTYCRNLVGTRRLKFHRFGQHSSKQSVLQTASPCSFVSRYLPHFQHAQSQILGVIVSKEYFSNVDGDPGLDRQQCSLVSHNPQGLVIFNRANLFSVNVRWHHQPFSSSARSCAASKSRSPL